MSRGWYDRFLLPHLIDLACGLKVFREQRAALVPKARGKVLEIGIGTGRNVEFYDRSKIEKVIRVDPPVEMHGLAARRAEEAGLPLELVAAPAEKLPLPDACADTALMTFTLCSLPEPLEALRELRRALKPGGRLLLCEHGLSPDEGVARWQKRLNPVWSPFAGGCRLDRDVSGLLRQAGFGTEGIRTGYLSGVRPITYYYWGECEST